MSDISKDLKEKIERIKYYLDFLEEDPVLFEGNSNIIDLQLHIYKLGELLKSKEHHLKRGYLDGYQRPKHVNEFK